jgi:hypothetical protein
MLPFVNDFTVAAYFGFAHEGASQHESHVHVFGAEQLPCAPQPAPPLQMAWSQSGPPQPESHEHLFGAEHLPCAPHDSSQDGVLQSAPE